MTDLSMTRVTTENTVNGVDVCGSDDVFVEDLRKSPAAAAADDDESVASSVLRRSYLSSPTISYTTPMAVIAMRQQIDAGGRRSSFSMMSASSLDLTSIPRRSSFSTSTSFDLGSRRSMSFMSLTDRSSGDEVDGDSRRLVFRRQESILETIERQRRENISRKLRQIRQSAPVPTAGRLGTLRRHRPSDEERPSETVSAVGPQTSKPLPVALPTIVPFNRTVSTSALQNMMLTTSLRTKGAGLGSGSGNGSASSINGIGVGGGGSGPMRANWSIGTSMAAAKRSSTSSQDCDVSQSAGNNSRSQLMTSAATKRNIEKWNDGSDTEDRSVRRTHQTPSDSERLPTFSTSYRHVIGRPVWRAASVDGLFSTLPDNNSNKTPPSTCTQQLKKDSSYLTSVKDDANEEVTEKDVGDSQPAAPGSNTTADASDRGTSSSPPQQLPPPSSRKTVDEKPVAEHSVPVMQASVIVAEAVTTRTTVDGGDVFEDVGDAAAAFFGEGAAPSTTVFRKPRPPSARSRGSRSPSPSPVAIKMTTLMTVSTEQSVFDTTSGPTLVQLSVGTQQETDSTGREQRCNEPANCSVASPSADEFIISSRDGSRSVSRSPWLSTTEIAPLIDLADSRSVSSPTGVEQQYASSCSDRLSHNNEDDNSGMLTPDSGIADIVAVSAVNHSAMSCSESPVNLVDETCSTDSWHNGELIDISVKAQNTDKRFDESNRQKLTTNNENSFIDRRTTAAVDERRYTRENANVENTNSLAFDELTTNVIAGREDEERQVKELVNGVTTLSSGKSFSTCDAATNDGRDAAKHSALVHLDLGNDLATTDDESSKRIAELPIDLHVGNIGDHSRKLADNDKLANGSCLSTLNRVEMFDEDHQEPTVALTNGDSEHRKSNVAERNVTYDKKPAEEIGEKCKVIDLVLVKDCVGIGFCIEGGSFVDRHSPIKVKRMFKGDTWAKGQLQAGDEIVRVNGQSFDALSHYDAWNFLKSVPDGVVHMTIRRHQ